MLSVPVYIQNEFAEWFDIIVHAGSVPELYQEIAKCCEEFDRTTCGQIVKIRIGEIVVDDQEDGYN